MPLAPRLLKSAELTLVERPRARFGWRPPASAGGGGLRRSLCCGWLLPDRRRVGIASSLLRRMLKLLRGMGDGSPEVGECTCTTGGCERSFSARSWSLRFLVLKRRRRPAAVPSFFCGPSWRDSVVCDTGGDWARFLADSGMSSSPCVRARGRGRWPVGVSPGISYAVEFVCASCGSEGSGTVPASFVVGCCPETDLASARSRSFFSRTR